MPPDRAVGRTTFFSFCKRMKCISEAPCRGAEIPLRREVKLTRMESDGLEDTGIVCHGFAIIRSTSFRIARHEGRWWIIMGKICRIRPFLSIR